VLPDGFRVLFDGVFTEPLRTPAVLPVVAPLFMGAPVVTPPPIAAPPLVELPPLLVCATANVLDSASAAVKANVVNFMVSLSAVR
jgi:hypothetical protein